MGVGYRREFGAERRHRHLQRTRRVARCAGSRDLSEHERGDVDAPSMTVTWGAARWISAERARVRRSDTLDGDRAVEALRWPDREGWLVVVLPSRARRVTVRRRG